MIHEDFAFKFARKKIMHRTYLRSFFDEASNFSSKECSSPPFVFSPRSKRCNFPASGRFKLGSPTFPGDH